MRNEISWRGPATNNLVDEWWRAHSNRGKAELWKRRALPFAIALVMRITAGELSLGTQATSRFDTQIKTKKNKTETFLILIFSFHYFLFSLLFYLARKPCSIYWTKSSFIPTLWLKFLFTFRFVTNTLLLFNIPTSSFLCIIFSNLIPFLSLSFSFILKT